jgi:membrane protease YdiL (CAAX protease family)
MVGEARVQGKGWHTVIELIAFIGVLFLGQFASTFVSAFVAVLLFGINSEGQILTDSDTLQVLSLFATLVATVVAMLYCRLIERRKLATLGFRSRGFIGEYFSGLILGFLLLAASLAICLLTNTMTFRGITPQIPWTMIILFFVGFLFQGMSEEVLCRGYLTVTLARRRSLVFSILVSSALFSAMHFFNPNTSILAFVNLFLFGVFAGVYFIKRGDIWGVGAIHSAWNFSQGHMFGIAVSGMASDSTIASFTPTAAGTLINGGAFGLEGGLAVTAVLTIGIIIMLLTKSRNVYRPAPPNPATMVPIATDSPAPPAPPQSGQ